MYVFDLPVDVAVKQFKDMNEAFWKYKKEENQTLPKSPLPSPFIITFPKAKPLIFSLKKKVLASYLKAKIVASSSKVAN